MPCVNMVFSYMAWKMQFKAMSLDDIKKLYKTSADDEKVLLDVKGLYTVKALDESGMRYWRL